jgi:cytochrome P450/ferredoxin-NADP reductase
MNAPELSPAPELDLDPFSLGVLADPYPGHAILREAGPLVHLSRYGIWAVARHVEVSAVLQDWRTFCSGRGGGLSDFAREKPWRPPSIILEADPPLHTRTRSVLSKVLSRPALMRLREHMRERADALLDEVLAGSHFEAVSRLAQAFPLTVFPDAVGVAREGRENLLPYGDMAFNAFGPRNELFEASMLKAAEVTAWIAAQCRRGALDANGFGAQIYAEVDRGTITEEEAGLLVRSLLTAGLDTTIHSLAHALHCFALWPDQWQAIRQDPSLIRNAFEEVIRYASPVQTFFRTTTRETQIGGTLIPEGEKVLLFLAAANRDPRRWQDPDRFDVHRDTTGHVGFGHGIHQCVGQMVARLEAEILIGALARRVRCFELDGQPGFRPNNTLRALERLPLRVELATRIVPNRVKAPTLELRVARKRIEALDICSFELVDPSGKRLPQFSPGAHLDVEVRQGLTRQYSLCNDRSDRHRYLIAVLREPASRGGSKALHEEIDEGQVIRVSEPKSHFRLATDARRSLLLAGGIGVTPILAMAMHLAKIGEEFEMHYCTRSLQRTAFLGRIRRSSFASRVHLHLDDGTADQKLNLTKVLDASDGSTHLYVCGPSGFMDFVLGAARAHGWAESRLHYEFFAAEVFRSDSDSEFDVELASSGRVVHVGRAQTVAQALVAAGVALPVSCEQGVCGTCLTGVLAGIPNHRDSYLTAEERAANRSFTPCCSRARTPRLVLDL